MVVVPSPRPPVEKAPQAIAFARQHRGTGRRASQPRNGKMNQERNLFVAAQHGDVARVQHLLSHGTSPNERDNEVHKIINSNEVRT
jgi:hypothetical protein